MLLAAYVIICISGYFVSLNEYKLATGNIEWGDWLMLPLAAGIYSRAPLVQDPVTWNAHENQPPPCLNDYVR